MKEKLQDNQTPTRDTLVRPVYETAIKEPNFKALPPEWSWVRNQFVEASEEPDFLRKYGLTDDADSILVFHGTTATRVPAILSKGMRAFEEASYQEPRIFVTASPTMALYHATERGPQDTLRAQGKLGDTHNSDDALLLAIRVPKEWLAGEPQAGLPIDQPDWLKEVQGLLPEEDNRLSAFNLGLSAEVAALQQGYEVSDFGVVFPVDHIPPEFIKVIGPGDRQSLFS